MSAVVENDILNSVENLKSTILKCQTENSHLLELVRGSKHSRSDSSTSSLQLFCAGGDNSEIKRNIVQCKEHVKTNLHSKLTHKEYLSMLIRQESEENLKLRESNIKLKQESKIQDQRIRELKRKMLLHDRNKQKSLSQTAIIEDLKVVIDSKKDEVRKMKRNLDNVKALLSKEQDKIKNMKEHQNGANSTPKTTTAIHNMIANIEFLLSQIDLQLSKGNKTHNSGGSSDDACNYQMQKSLIRLRNISSKLDKIRELYTHQNYSVTVKINKLRDTKHGDFISDKISNINVKCEQDLMISPERKALNLSNSTHANDFNSKDKHCFKPNCTSYSRTSEVKHRRAKSASF